MIFGALLVAPRLAEPTYGLAAGVLLGGVLQIAVQFPQLARLRAVGRPALGWRDPAVRACSSSWRRGSSHTGSTRSTSSSRRDSRRPRRRPASRISTTRTGLKELVLGGFAVSLATAILPLLSRQALSPDRGRFKENLAFALRLIAFVTLPATVGLILLRDADRPSPLRGRPIRRRRHGGDGRRARDALPSGLFFFAGVRVVVPAFYALKDTRLPVLAALADCAVVHRCSASPDPAARPPGNRARRLRGGRRQRRDPRSRCCAAREGRLHGREIAVSIARVAAASAVDGRALVGAGRWLDLDAPARLARARGCSRRDRRRRRPLYWAAAMPSGRARSPRELAAASRAGGGRAREARPPAGLARRRSGRGGASSGGSAGACSSSSARRRATARARPRRRPARSRACASSRTRTGR